MESAGVEVWQNVCYGGCSRVGQDILMGQDRTGQEFYYFCLLVKCD